MKDNAQAQVPVLLWIPPHRPRPRGGIEILLTSLLGVVLFFSACDTADSQRVETAGIFEVEVNGERFHVALATEEQVDVAEAHMESGREGVLHGTIRRGDGGFNEPYDWHLEPASVTFPDMAMEVCDGRPNSEVQIDVDYWVDTIGYYCQWGARIVSRVD